MAVETVDFHDEKFVDVDQLDFGDEQQHREVSEDTINPQIVLGKSTDNIEKVIDLSSKFLELGKYVFKDVAEALGSIVGVGGLVKAIMKFIPDEPNPIFEKLATLEGKIDKLSEKMSAKFDDLKAFITELNFFVEVINPSSNLMKLMMDCMKHPSEEGVENFIAAYQKTPPLILAYTVLSLLERKSTNPLKMAMDADPFKTTTTFNKWYDIINGVLGEFLFLEAFGSGLLEKKDHYNAHRIMEKSEHLFERIEEWKEEYKKNNQYWGSLEEYVRDFMKNSVDLNREKRAEFLEKFLGSIITSDAFYLGVYHKWETDRYAHYTYLIHDRENRFIEVFGADETNVFIYKSHANHVDERWMTELKRTVEEIQFDVKEFRKSYKDYPKKLAEKIGIVVGFICVIGNLGEIIRGVNCIRNDGRPGWDRIMISEKDRNGNRAFRTLVVGF